MLKMMAGWQDLWKPLGLTPQSPSEMAKWRQQVREILERYESLEAKRGELASLGEDLSQARELLGRFMEEHGRTTDVEASAEFLYQEATTWHRELQKAWTAVREIAVARKAAADKLVEAQDDMDKADSLIKVVRKQWPEALVAIAWHQKHQSQKSLPPSMCGKVLEFRSSVGSARHEASKGSNVTSTNSRRTSFHSQLRSLRDSPTQMQEAFFRVS